MTSNFLRQLVSILSLAAILALPACREAPPEKAPTPAVVAYPNLAVLSPAMAVILHDLKRPGSIAGRHGFDSVTDQEIPVVGSQTDLDYEALLRIRPTHVLLETGAKDIPPRLRELAATHGWQVETLPALRLSDIRVQIARLDEISAGLDAGESSTEGAELLKRFDAAMRVREGIDVRLGRTLPLVGTNPLGILGPGSFHAEMLHALGATPIPEQGAPFINADVEEVIKLDPDSLILFLPGAEETDLAELLGPLAKTSMRAVRSGRVLVIRDPLCHSPSSALIGVADEIAERVESWLPLDAPTLPADLGPGPGESVR